MKQNEDGVIACADLREIVIESRKQFHIYRFRNLLIKGVLFGYVNSLSHSAAMAFGSLETFSGEGELTVTVNMPNTSSATR